MIIFIQIDITLKKYNLFNRMICLAEEVLNKSKAHNPINGYRHPIFDFIKFALELKRGCKAGEYQADSAHEAYEKRRERSVPSGKWTTAREQYIAGKLVQTWSPEQIAGRMSQECPEQKVSCKTIYRWLYQGLLVILPKTPRRSLFRPWNS